MLHTKILLACLGVLIGVGTGATADWGIRTGVAVPVLAAHESHSFALTEVTAYAPVFRPRGWELGLEASAGVLLRHTTPGVLVSLTPTARVHLTEALAVQAQAGVGYLTRARYQALDLGGPFVVRPAVGVHYAFSPTLRLEGTWTHLSNAGIYRDNPGLDLLTVGLRWIW